MPNPFGPSDYGQSPARRGFHDYGYNPGEHLAGEDHCHDQDDEFDDDSIDLDEFGIDASLFDDEHDDVVEADDGTPSDEFEIPGSHDETADLLPDGRHVATLLRQGVRNSEVWLDDLIDNTFVDGLLLNKWTPESRAKALATRKRNHALKTSAGAVALTKGLKAPRGMGAEFTSAARKVAGAADHRGAASGHMSLATAHLKASRMLAARGDREGARAHKAAADLHADAGMRRSALHETEPGSHAPSAPSRATRPDATFRHSADAMRASSGLRGPGHLAEGFRNSFDAISKAQTHAEAGTHHRILSSLHNEAALHYRANGNTGMAEAHEAAASAHLGAAKSHERKGSASLGHTGDVGHVSVKSPGRSGVRNCYYYERSELLLPLPPTLNDLQSAELFDDGDDGYGSLLGADPLAMPGDGDE